MPPTGPSPPQNPAASLQDEATSRHDGARTSRFTYKQLADFAAAAPTCPLRVIAHIDLDAYYAQCEMRRLGTAEETPLVVQQWRNIIAVNYPARAFGISRMISAAEAKRLCPDLVVQHVPTWKEGETQWAYREDAFSAMAEHKVSLEPYRIRSREILATIKESLPGTGAQACKLEKAGIDEVFVDLSAYVHELLVNRLYSDVLADYHKHHHDQPTAFLPLPPVTEADLDWAATGSDIIDDKGGTGSKPTEREEGAVEDENRSIHEEEHKEDEDSEHINERVIDWDDVAMLEGARIIRAVRQALSDKLQFRCSAGIASNKMLSKLGSSQHKPNKQTVVRPRAVATFLGGLKSVTKLRGLGGKMGARVIAAFDTESISELRTLSLAQMQAKLNDQEAGYHIHGMVRGIDTSEVTARTEIKSIISAKSFQPPLKTMDQAIRWLRVYAAELKCRLLDEKLSLALLAAATVSADGKEEKDDKDDKNEASGGDNPLPATTVHTSAHQQHFQRLRLPQTIRLHYGDGSNGFHWKSRQTRIPRDGTPLDEDKLLKLGTQLLEQAQRADVLWPCAHLAISVDGFEEPVKNNKSIESFFQKATAKPASTTSKPTEISEESGGRDENEDEDQDDLDNSLREAGDFDEAMPLTKRRRTDHRDATDTNNTATLPFLFQREAEHAVARQGQGIGGAERARLVDEQPRATSSASSRRSTITTVADAGAALSSSNVSSVPTYFKPKDDDVSRIGHANEGDSASGGPFACGRCRKSFPAAIQLQEHEDWHVARELQAMDKQERQERQERQEKPTSAASTPTPTASSTRLRGHVPLKRAAPTLPANPISSFFQNRARSPTKKEDSGGSNGAGATTAAAAAATAAGSLTCQRCGDTFGHPDSLQVHQDWHFAKDLETG
ncbi:N-acetyltransferase eso1 [Sporothrix stenoceras]|uniref:DNA polymerase eta n=1 Tax=Sporothrix stenoceras TaxID=5173 RepID=A0ABR3YIA8_9PEZI